MKIWLLPLVIFLSIPYVADASDDFGFFIKHEINGDDYISGIGIEGWLIDHNTHLGMAVNTSIGSAKVFDEDHHQQSYLAWDLGFRFGYFSSVYVYGEVGVDMGELILQDRNEDDHYYYDNNQEDSLIDDLVDIVLLDHRRKRNDHDNDIDAYIGAGVGVRFDGIAIEAFTRYRQIDGEYWRADNQMYSGIKLSVGF